MHAPEVRVERKRFEESVRGATVADIAAIAQARRDYILTRYTSFNTIASELSKSNAFIKRTMGEAGWHVSKDILLPDRALKAAQIKATKARNMEQLKERDVKTDLQTYRLFIEILNDSEDYFDRVACVIAATGRRPTEVTKTGTFTCIGNEDKDEDKVKKPTHLWFNGQLKRRAHAENKDVPFLIPCLFLTPQRVCELVSALRAQRNYSSMTNTETSRDTCKGINEVFRILFGVDNKVTACAARGLWAFIAYRLHASPRVSEIWWSANALGHQEGDLQTFASTYARNFVDMSR